MTQQRKFAFIQFLRRTVQISASLLVLGLIFLSLYGHYRAARALEDETRILGWRGQVLTAIDGVVSSREDPQAFLDSNKGTFWSMRLGGVELTDPLAAAEATAASRQIHLPLLFAILIPVALTLILGKVFCSWLCPAGLLFEITGKLRGLLRFAELPPGEVEFSKTNKYVLLFVGLALAAGLGLPLFSLVYPPAVMSRLAHAWIFGTAAAGMLTLMALMVAIELLVSPRWWCRTMCPGGALYGIFGWSRVLRIKLNAVKCTGCKDCEPVCEPGLNPVLESSSIECDNCMVCIRHCPEDALVLTSGLPGRKNTLRVPSVAADARQGASSAIPVALSLVFLLAGAAQVDAHHILGLPHYAYKENYPQAPTLEYPASSGPLDILLTSYPGHPVAGEAATLAFYIKDRATGKPQEQDIRVRVYETLNFGRTREIVPSTRVPPFEVPHKLAATFPQDGSYLIELTLEVEGKDEVIPFPIVIGNPTGGAALIGMSTGAMTIFLIVIRAIRIKRRRRLRQAAGTGSNLDELKELPPLKEVTG